MSQPVIAPAGVQALQVLTVLFGAPLVSGATSKVEALMQGRRGPRVLQPYYDLAKLFRKETVVPEGASWVFLAGPVVAFSSYLTVPLLIPVLTSYGLPLGYMGDILGGGMLLALGSFATALAASDSGAPYAQLGASRAMAFSALAEPTLLFVFFVVAMLTSTDLPYALAATVRSTSEAVRPSHVLVAAAFFLVVLADTGRIPVEAHAGTLELGMVDEARTLEHSGAPFALIKWGSALKQLVLYTIFINVFVAPWGLASSGKATDVVAAVFSLLGKALLLGVVFAVIDNSFSKLRLFKVTEFLAAAFLLACLGVVVFYLGGA